MQQVASCASSRCSSCWPAGAAAAQHQHGKPARRAGGLHRHAGLRARRHAVAGARRRPTASSSLRSTDLGQTFSAPVAVTPEPMNLDWGPDARARIAVDPKGGLVVTFAIFQDKNFNGRAFFARSTDNGASFTHAAAAHRRHDQPALRDAWRSIPPAGSSPPGSTSATSPRPAPPASPIRARRSPLPGRTTTARLRRHDASRSTIPANAAASASPSPAPAGRP